MSLITRAEWGARPPTGAYSPATHNGQGTVHYSATPITKTGHQASTPPPEKPGPKWYRLWRSKATPRIQRIRLSRAIRRYNAAARAWKAGQKVDADVAAQERAIVRQFQSFHQGPSRGWLDIGYHRIVFASGNVYEGRPLGVQGAHAVGANWTVGYCFVMGEGDEPTPYMLRAFREQAERDGVFRFAGHRQRPGNSTSCPGEALIRALDL